MIITKTIKTKIGFITLKAKNDLLCELSISKEKSLTQDVQKKDHPIQNWASEINSYINQDTKSFSIPFQLDGTTFQKKVWQTLLTIPYAKTVSYKELARLSGFPKAVRAAGSACSKNPLPIIIPCHRITKSNGEVGSYLFGSKIKTQLITLESMNNG